MTPAGAISLGPGPFHCNRRDSALRFLSGMTSTIDTSFLIWLALPCRTVLIRRLLPTRQLRGTVWEDQIAMIFNENLTRRTIVTSCGIESGFPNIRPRSEPDSQLVRNSGRMRLDLKVTRAAPWACQQFPRRVFWHRLKRQIGAMHSGHRPNLAMPIDGSAVTRISVRDLSVLRLSRFHAPLTQAASPNRSQKTARIERKTRFESSGLCRWRA